MAGNMLMINVGVNSKDAENSLASLEETLKNISKQDAELKVGENLAAEVENARKKYLDMVKMVNSTEGELQKAFAISGLRQTIADVNALNKKIAETGAKIKPIELQSVMFDGKELFDIKGIDKSLDKFTKKLDKDSNDAFANILTTNLGQKFFSKQKNELEKQLETDLKDLAKNFSQDKLEQYINKYLKIRSIDVAKSGKDKIATSGVTPKAITDLIDNKAISKQLAEGKIDVKAMFQKKATDVGFVKNMKDQIFSELMVFLNQNTDANTFGTKYTDAQMTEMTQGAKESKKQIKLLKEEFIGLINQYNGFNRNSKIELVLDTVARIESLRKELKGLGQDISEINNIEKQDEYKENLNTLKYTLIPDGNDDYYDEDFDTYLLKLKNDFNKLNNTNIQSIMSMNIGDEKKIEKLKENLTQIDELLIKTNSYDSIVPNVSSEVIGDIEILKKQRGQIIAGLKQLNVDVAGVGIPMADYIAGGNKGSGGSGSGTVSGSGNYDSSEVDALKTKLTETQTEAEKLKTALDSANTELEKLKGLSSQSENDNNKITMLTAQVNELTQKLTSAEEKKKALESQIASSGSMNNSSGSVQLGEGEQIAKTSNIEAVKKLSDSIKNLQDRMSKAEEILKEVPQGMDGLKKLSSQIEKMSGNFNEDGSIKNMGVSAEALSEQLKNLNAEFDARITKKIEELEKKSYKENQPKKKFKLAESVKSLKVVAEKAAPKVEAKQVDNDVKSAQQDAAVKTEETTKELYKETEEYKTLSKAVQEYNALTSQKLDATAYDARIERLQKMQALVTSIIETVEKYEGKASELSALTLKSKNGNIGIQDTVRLDELMSKLKAGEAKNVSKKEEAAQAEQLKQDAQKYVDVVRDYNNKFQSIISQKVSSGKQFNSMKQQLNDLSNSIDAIMNKYNKLKGQDFYSADFAKYGNELWSKVKDASLDLNEITKYTKHEQEILNIQLKYSESLQRQKKEQDAVAEAARKKAEAEKEATKAAEETENKMSAAEKSREEQKRKVLEKQAAQSGGQTSNNNSTPADNTTLGAILTEVKSINGKMDKPVKAEVANNTGMLTNDERSSLEEYKNKSKEDQSLNLWSNYGFDSVQLTKAKITAFSGSLEQLFEIIQDTLANRQDKIADEMQNSSGSYDEDRAYNTIYEVQQLAGVLELLNNRIRTNDTQDTAFDLTAINNILAEVKSINGKMSSVNSPSEEVNELSKTIYEWSQAIKIQKETGAEEVERAAVGNSASGRMGNTFVTDEPKQIKGEVGNALIENAQEAIGEVNTFIHSHPEEFAILSYNDFVLAFEYWRKGVINNLKAVAQNDVMSVDFTSFDKSLAESEEFSSMFSTFTNEIRHISEEVSNTKLSEYYQSGSFDKFLKSINSEAFEHYDGLRGVVEAAFAPFYSNNGNELSQTINSGLQTAINQYIDSIITDTSKTPNNIEDFRQGMLSVYDTYINKFISEGSYTNGEMDEYLYDFKDVFDKYIQRMILDIKQLNPDVKFLGEYDIEGDLIETQKRTMELGREWFGEGFIKLQTIDEYLKENPIKKTGGTTPNLSTEVQAASEAATAEVAAFNTIDNAVTGLTGDINAKTEAIRAEQQTMATAAESEVASISQIKQAVSDLAIQIHNVPEVKIVGENDGKLNISANLTEEQIAVIREKLKAAFSGEQAVPISFVPNVEGLKQQIAEALKNVPVEITNNNINKVIKVNKFKANSDGVEALRNSISSQLKNVKIQSFDATTAAESVKQTLSKVLDGVGLKFDTEKLGNEVREAVNAGVEAANAGQKPDTSENKAIRFKEKATSDIGKLRDKYTDKLQGQQLEVFKERLNEIDNKIKEIKDDASNYTDENAQVIEKDIKQIETLVNSFKEINNSEDKINSLIQKLKDSKNNIERRGAVAQPVVNNINSEMSALEELKRSGQNLNVGNPAEVQAFIDKLHEADATVESLQQSAKDIRVSTNATASVAKLDSKFNDLLFKVDKFKRDNSKITSDKGISAQFDSLMRSIQTIEKSDVNFQRLKAQFDQLKATVQGKGLTGRSLGDELKYIAEKIGIKALLGNSIYRVIGAFRQMVGIVTELDTGMTTLRRVTEETEATYRKFLKTAGDEAHELGSTVSNLVSSTGDFARLGYNIQESSELAKNALMYSNVGWLDIQTATADMTSTMKAFNITAQDSVKIVDVFDILGNKYAVTAANIGEGLKESASALATANNSMEQSAAMITAITEITQDASSAGELRCPKMWKHIDESSYIG